MGQTGSKNLLIPPMDDLDSIEKLANAVRALAAVLDESHRRAWDDIADIYESTPKSKLLSTIRRTDTVADADPAKGSIIRGSGDTPSVWEDYPISDGEEGEALTKINSQIVWDLPGLRLFVLRLTMAAVPAENSQSDIVLLDHSIDWRNRIISPEVIFSDLNQGHVYYDADPYENFIAADVLDDTATEVVAESGHDHTLLRTEAKFYGSGHDQAAVDTNRRYRLGDGTNLGYLLHCIGHKVYAWVSAGGDAGLAAGDLGLYCYKGGLGPGSNMPITYATIPLLLRYSPQITDTDYHKSFSLSGD